MEVSITVWLFGLFGSILLILLRQQVLNNQKINEVLVDIKESLARFDERIKHLEKEK